nr:LOW QUALITY PROTEIN: acyl-CoA desaturase [Pelodiscus sinensis]|eukprot:XP_025033672.1 LOW QUALITY PROTEIN: acyl-CoA desaturase [Pelodiscus sinensis]
MTDDIFDTSYHEKEGPKPARRYVWRNIVLMSLLHAGALYGLWLAPAAKPLTMEWGKQGGALSRPAPRAQEGPVLAVLPQAPCCKARPALTLREVPGGLSGWFPPSQHQACCPLNPVAAGRPTRPGGTPLALQSCGIQRPCRLPCRFWDPSPVGFLCFLLSFLGVTAGAHRLWSHRSYKASLPLRLRVFLAFPTSWAFQNDIYEWARDHRVHHKFSETNADPHNATRGFFFSHIGWLLVRKHPDVLEKGSKLELADLKADKVVMFQRRFYKPSVVVMCFLLPTLVPWCCWGESLCNSFFLPAILRYVLVLNASWLVNSAAHMFGNRPYDRTINPRENRLVTLGALGEGFHNYHHTFPYDYATSEFGWHYNFTTAFIDLMCLLGLASDRKKVSREVVLARKIRTGDGSHKTG